MTDIGNVACVGGPHKWNYQVLNNNGANQESGKNSYWDNYLENVSDNYSRLLGVEMGLDFAYGPGQNPRLENISRSVRETVGINGTGEECGLGPIEEKSYKFTSDNFSIDAYAKLWIFSTFGIGGFYEINALNIGDNDLIGSKYVPEGSQGGCGNGGEWASGVGIDVGSPVYGLDLDIRYPTIPLFRSEGNAVSFRPFLEFPFVTNRLPVYYQKSDSSWGVVHERNEHRFGYLVPEIGANFKVGLGLQLKFDFFSGYIKMFYKQERFKGSFKGEYKSTKFKQDNGNFYGLGFSGQFSFISLGTEKQIKNK